ncbi:MAG TPA: hypothetical protein ENJ35_03020, partial [Gammaproteobacteria bacterium]|nr:hypothetical protein [Gammaproteobacteria bacterium]
MARLLKWLGGLLLLILLLVIGLLGYAVTTESGLQQLLSLGQRFAPGELSWQRADGQLSGPLDLAGLGYRQADGLSIQVDQAALRWQPSALFSRNLAIQRLSLSGVEIHLPRGEEKKEAAPGQPLVLPDIHLPIDISIDELDLEDIRIYPWGAEKPIVVQKVSLSALGEGDSLQLVNLDVRAPEGEVHLAGTVEPVGSYPLDLQLNWRFRHAEFGEFKGSGTADGDLKKMHLKQEVAGAISADLTAEVTDVISQPGWDVKLELSAENLGVFSPALQESPLQASITSKGSLQQFTASGHIATAVEQTGAVALDFLAQGNTRAIEIEKAVLKLVDEPGEIALAGKVDLQPLGLSLKGNWRELGWPVKSKKREYRLPKGRLTFNGDPKDFTASVSTNLEGDQLGKLRLKLDAQGKGDQLRLSALDLTSPDSKLRLQASGEFDVKQKTVAAKGHWESIRWPLAGVSQPLVESPKGAFTVGGKLDDYRFKLAADARGKDIPEGEWKLTGKGTDRDLAGFKLTGKLLDGVLNASGKAAWKPSATWDVSLDGQGLNPGVKWPEVPGKINLSLMSKGGLVDGKPDLIAKVDSLRGEFRGQRLRGSGEITVKNDTLKVHGVKLTGGTASLTANGELGDRWDLDWRLKVP